MLATTHGVMPYHPSPTDYWRWTHAGLEKLFVGTASWESVRVTPSSGTTACLGMLISIYLDLGFRRIGLGVARKADRGGDQHGRHGYRRALEEPERARPPGLFANFHVVAEAPR